jgi:hypothetical protein
LFEEDTEVGVYGAALPNTGSGVEHSNNNFLLLTITLIVICAVGAVLSQLRDEKG